MLDNVTVPKYHKTDISIKKSSYISALNFSLVKKVPNLYKRSNKVWYANKHVMDLFSNNNTNNSAKSCFYSLYCFTVQYTYFLYKKETVIKNKV